jgi:hypothetical protein
MTQQNALSNLKEKDVIAKFYVTLIHQNNWVFLSPNIVTVRKTDPTLEKIKEVDHKDKSLFDRYSIIVTESISS